MARLTINGKALEVNVDPSTPLLWVIREQVGLTGTKYGCGVAQCGACTVHLDGAAIRSCVMRPGTRRSHSSSSAKSLLIARAIVWHLLHFCAKSA